MYKNGMEKSAREVDLDTTVTLGQMHASGVIEFDASIKVTFEDSEYIVCKMS